MIVSRAGREKSSTYVLTKAAAADLRQIVRCLVPQCVSRRLALRPHCRKLFLHIR